MNVIRPLRTHKLQTLVPKRVWGLWGEKRVVLGRKTRLSKGAEVSNDFI